ncbi:MAG: glycosyltransferase [bacterium]
MNKDSEDESIIKDIGLLMTTYNRPKYVWKTLRSLKKSDLGLLRRIIIVDDGSNSKITLWFIKRFNVDNIKVDVIIKERDGNKIHTSMLKGWNILYKDDQINFICNLDSDTIVKRHWLKELKKNICKGKKW